MVKNLPTDVGDIRDGGLIPGLGRSSRRGRGNPLQDSLETEMATHSRILAGRTSWTEEAGGLQSMGSQRVRHNLVTQQQHKIISLNKK